MTSSRAPTNLLLTFTKIGKDIFPDATAAVLDMAAALGTDANSAAKTLGKALQDPIKGMTALRRVGVILTEEQERQVKALIKQNDLYGAQRIILGEVEKKYHGVAQAQADADPGRRLAVSVERFQKALATGLLPVIEKVQTRLDRLAVQARDARSHQARSAMPSAACSPTRTSTPLRRGSRSPPRQSRRRSARSTPCRPRSRPLPSGRSPSTR